MNLEDFSYSYPDELVAMYPSDKRDASRLMIVDRIAQKISHQNFSSIVEIMSPGDVLVVNTSKVIPARLITQNSKGKRLEFFLLREIEKDIWSCLVPRKCNIGDEFSFDSKLFLKIIGPIEPIKPTGPIKNVRLKYEGSFQDVLAKVGHIPLPPYIKRSDQKDFDTERYQTIYAQKEGSVAAPTAGLHFTESILEKMKNKGVIIAPLNLHVGLGTFLPIRTETIEDHQMHEEFFEIPSETALKINQAKKEKRKIWVVGTTCVRALESSVNDAGVVIAGDSVTTKFIYPPYDFKVVDHLITNFHQPRSTLLVLVSTFASKNLIDKAYQEAIQQKYRLFSYGDCMLIL